MSVLDASSIDNAEDPRLVKSLEYKIVGGECPLGGNSIHAIQSVVGKWEMMVILVVMMMLVSWSTCGDPAPSRSIVSNSKPQLPLFFDVVLGGVGGPFLAYDLCRCLLLPLDRKAEKFDIWGWIPIIQPSFSLNSSMADENIPWDVILCCCRLESVTQRKKRMG